MSNKHEFSNSSSLRHCDYDTATGKMTICFQSGGTYEYDCDQSCFEALKAAKSAGSHFHQHIKPHYKGVKV